MVENTFELKD